MASAVALCSRLRQAARSARRERQDQELGSKLFRTSKGKEVTLKFRLTAKPRTLTAPERRASSPAPSSKHATAPICSSVSTGQ